MYRGGEGDSSSHHDEIRRKGLLDSDDTSADSNEEWMRKYMRVECKDEQWYKGGGQGKGVYSS